MSFYICVFSNIFAKQIYSFINAQEGQIKIFSPDPFVAKYFFYLSLSLLPFKYEKSALKVYCSYCLREGIWKEGVEGGERVTLKEFQESFFPASKLNY